MLFALFFVFVFVFFYTDFVVKLLNEGKAKNQVAIDERNLISEAPKCRNFLCVVCFWRTSGVCAFTFRFFVSDLAVSCFSVRSLFVPVKNRSLLCLFIIIIMMIFWLMRCFYEAPILKTKEGLYFYLFVFIFQCASFEKREKKEASYSSCVLNVDMQWKRRAESCVLHVLSSRSPPLLPPPRPGFSPPWCFSLLSRTKGLVCLYPLLYIQCLYRYV